MRNVPRTLKSFLSRTTAIFATFLFGCKAFNQGSSESMAYINFMMDELSYLNITSLITVQTQDESKCSFACLEIPACFSYNLAVLPDINRKLSCELLPSDKYNNSEMLLSSQVYHHFSMTSPCTSGPCKNSGKCFSLYDENNFLCVCTEGFTGNTCETNVDECASNPCLNNGTCIDRVNGFNCSCPPGLSGQRCETDILNQCDSNPCLNNGSCKGGFNAFNCSCPSGFAGSRCEFPDFSAAFTCDNAMEMFADGKSLGRDNSNWGIASSFVVPGDARVISVAGQHFGGSFGILGSFSNAVVICFPDGISRISMTSSGLLQL